MHGVRRYACDASVPAEVELLFRNVAQDLGAPTLVVHNIDGRVAQILRKGIAEADPYLALATLRNSTFSAFLVGQQAARVMRANEPDVNGARGIIIFTNASAALKGFALSAAFAMACSAGEGRGRRPRRHPGAALRSTGDGSLARYRIQPSASSSGSSTSPGPTIRNLSALSR